MNQWQIVGRLAVIGFPMAVLSSGTEAQTASLRGTVTSAPTGLPIGGALVSLSGLSQRADSSGRFRFDGVTQGQHTLAVRALGYLPISTRITLRGDTVLTITLEQRSVTLDTLIVHGKTATVVVNAIDPVSGNNLLRAHARAFPGSETIGALNGKVTFRAVPIGSTFQVSLEALEYLPAFVELAVTGDTVVRVPMQKDSIAMRLIAAQVRRLGQRANAIPYPIDDLNRKDIRESGVLVVGELILRRLPASNRPSALPTKCVFLDDREIDSALLMALPPEEVERVEIYRRGRMIRVYTTHYVASLARVADIPRVFYMASGIGVSCA